MGRIIERLMEKYRSLGLLGVIDNIIFLFRKSLMWVYYIGRFKTRGRDITFEGQMTIVGAKNIKVGSKVVFGSNVKLVSEDEGEIIIGDGCFIADNVLISARGMVAVGRGTRIHEFSSIEGRDIRLGEDVWVLKVCSLIGINIAV
ncbi:MAG: hypothetical protein PHT95_06435, partial [Candidatus Omnitrophica bacterium]|nr:hypothetical protein [Candidatus Omnitrophota bacterium]